MESAGNEQLESVELLNPINFQNYPNDKLSVMDLKAADFKGNRYNIEIQVAIEEDFISRIIYYNDILYSEQIIKATPYFKANRSISVSILNFNLLKEESSIHNIYRYCNLVSKKELTNLKELHFIELRKYDAKKARSEKTKFEKWLSIIKLEDFTMENIPKDIQSDVDFIDTIYEVQKANSDPYLRAVLEAREKAERDEASRLYFSNKRAEEKGRQEERLFTILNMIKSGFTYEQIANLYGLSIEEIMRIAKENSN